MSAGGVDFAIFRVLEAPRERARRLLHMQAQAMVADMMREGERRFGAV